MSSPNGKNAWWQTLPGILTAFAAIITAVTGLIVGLYQIGMFERDPGDRTEAVVAGTEAAGGSGAVITDSDLGTLVTSAGTIVFDRITRMSMEQGALTISRLGANPEIPLEDIRTLTFMEGETVQVDYRTGESEQVTFSCYWNLPVTFHRGEAEYYYGDCSDFEVVERIEFRP